MTFLFLLWFAVTVSIGLLLTLCLWPNHSTSPSELLTKLSVAVGVGLGTSSSLFFAWLLVAPTSPVLLFLSETLLFVGLIYNGFKRREPLHLNWVFSMRRLGFGNLTFVSVAFCLALASTALVFLQLSFQSPHGGYDGWEIWNMRARFLYRGGSHWTDSFSNLLYYSHPDYPLLLPASIARSWLYIGNETQSTPIAIAMLFMLATVGLLCASVSLLRSTTQGCLAGLVLLGTPFFSIHAAAQYADVPLGFYMLATLVLLSLAGDVEKGDRGLLALAGMMAGFSAWTKNEGSLFLCAVLVAFFGLSIFLKGHNYGWREIIPFTGFLLPILAVVFYFKTTLAPPNDLLHAERLQTTIGKLVTPSRYKEVARAFFDRSFHFGKWPWYVNVPLILAFFSLLVGIDVERQHWWVTASCILALALIVTGYFFTYIITPRPLEWHLSTSLDRLFLQLWPSVIFTYFMIVRTPDNALSSAPA